MMLTEREIAILLLRQQGLTQAVIARKLKVSQAAVSDFETNAYRKLRAAKAMLATAARYRIMVPEGH